MLQSWRLWNIHRLCSSSSTSVCSCCDGILSVFLNGERWRQSLAGTFSRPNDIRVLRTSGDTKSMNERYSHAGHLPTHGNCRVHHASFIRRCSRTNLHDFFSVSFSRFIPGEMKISSGWRPTVKKSKILCFFQLERRGWRDHKKKLFFRLNDDDETRVWIQIQKEM